MTTAAIRKKLVEYLQVADSDKVKAIYTMVADDIETSAHDWDASMVKELENRRKSFEKGSAKTYSWEATKDAAIKKAKMRK